MEGQASIRCETINLLARQTFFDDRPQRYEFLEINGGIYAHGFKHIDKVFSHNIAASPRRGWTTPQPALRTVKDRNALFKSRKSIRNA